jgi:hypothetical protein
MIANRGDSGYKTTNTDYAVSVWMRNMGFKIYVGSESGAPDLASDGICIANLDFTSYTVKDVVPGWVSYDCTGGVHTGRYVKIWRNGIINLAEVKVLFTYESGSMLHLEKHPKYIQKYGSMTTVDACAAAVWDLRGKDGCHGDFFYFEMPSGRCNCPMARSSVPAGSSGIDNAVSAGLPGAPSPGDLYEFDWYTTTTTTTTVAAWVRVAYALPIPRPVNETIQDTFTPGDDMFPNPEKIPPDVELGPFDGIGQVIPGIEESLLSVGMCSNQCANDPETDCQGIVRCDATQPMNPDNKGHRCSKVNKQSGYLTQNVSMPMWYDRNCSFFYNVHVLDDVPPTVTYHRANGGYPVNDGQNVLAYVNEADRAAQENLEPIVGDLGENIGPYVKVHRVEIAPAPPANVTTPEGCDKICEYTANCKGFAKCRTPDDGPDAGNGFDCYLKDDSYVVTPTVPATDCTAAWDTWRQDAENAKWCGPEQTGAPADGLVLEQKYDCDGEIKT